MGRDRGQGDGQLGGGKSDSHAHQEREPKLEAACSEGDSDSGGDGSYAGNQRERIPAQAAAKVYGRRALKDDDVDVPHSVCPPCVSCEDASRAIDIGDVAAASESINQSVAAPTASASGANQTSKSAPGDVEAVTAVETVTVIEAGTAVEAVTAVEVVTEVVAGITFEGDALSLGLVAVRDTGGPKGNGVFAAAPLAFNTWIGDYQGEVLTQKKYLRRYPNEDAQYVLGCNEDYNIDAADPAKSTFTRFLNHATGAAANCVFDIAKVRRQRAKAVKFYTSRDVSVGEELCFDYGPSYWRDRGVAPVV